MSWTRSEVPADITFLDEPILGNIRPEQFDINNINALCQLFQTTENMLVFSFIYSPIFETVFEITALFPVCYTISNRYLMASFLASAGEGELQSQIEHSDQSSSFNACYASCCPCRRACYSCDHGDVAEKTRDGEKNFDQRPSKQTRSPRCQCNQRSRHHALDDEHACGTSLGHCCPRCHHDIPGEARGC